MSQHKQVSIITPSYNQEDFIEETILSVKGQDYPNLEHVIVDGASTDGTLGILKKYEDQYNLRWISEPDKGQSDAINKGFRIAKGEVFGWINSDDTYLPGAITTAIDTLNSLEEIEWVHGNGYRIDEKSYVTDEFPVKCYDFHDLLIYGMHMVQPSIFFYREILETVGFIDPDIHTTLDYDFMLRVSREYPGKFISRFISTRRYHSAAKSVAHPEKFYKDHIKSLDKVFADPKLPSEFRKLQKQAYAHANLVGGYNYYQEGDFETAKRLFLNALRLHPRPWKKGTLSVLLLLLEIEIGVHVLRPGMSRRVAERRYQRSQGINYVGWKQQFE